ncbi:NPCBM/NEW2 domain-containing protein [Marinagarivorans cellulosilyticus]|uniref:Glycosyl hydrolase family 98 putative carbohydrate-binding module domain-containing protein n=1 Tax=Marinagarivorans cellulosilyticus TaxID=2721545 RepID=A0AAN2BJL2_9GAMM|nr:NPCBM/NEW2 domain-containing protein [Marinagarivorans cellulosilyticus]BCD97067.1 hypothetical protein MARGE09_P1267 [Marinagarivorans cellulosilyticus]
MLKELSRYQLFAFILIAATTIATRFIWLGDLPGGLNQDEASMGYDAYALLEYGIDRNGVHNPVHMIAWGSGQNALLAYLSMPFIKVFGLSVFSIRVAPALLGCIAVWVMYLLGRRLEGINFGLLAAAITAISPWHIMVSRWALESNILPVFMLISVYFLVKASEHKRLLPLSFLFFGISLYAYAPSYLVIPLFLFFAGIYCIGFRVFSFKNISISTLVLVVTALPIFTFVVINTYKLPAFESGILSIPRYTGSPRYTHMSSIYGGSFIQDTLQHLGHSIKILFIDFNDYETQNSAPNVGYLPKYSLPLIIGGALLIIFRVAKSKTFTPFALVLFWFLASFLVSGTSSPAIHRMNTIVFPIILFFAYGLYQLFKYNRTIAITFCLIFSITTYHFYKVYSGEYAKQVSAFFFEGYGQAVEDAYQHLIDDEVLYASDALNQPYIATLFHLKYNPHEYISTVEFKNPDGAFQAVLKYGSIVFGVRTPEAKRANIVVIRKGDDARHYNLKKYLQREYNDYLVLYSKEVFHEDSNGNIERADSFFKIAPPQKQGKNYIFDAHISPNARTSLTARSLYGNQQKTLKFFWEAVSQKITIDSKQLYLGSNIVTFTADSPDGRKVLREFILTQYNDSIVNPLTFLISSTQDVRQNQVNKAFTGDHLSSGNVFFSDGFGTHASSNHIIDLPENSKIMNISYGISDFSGGCGDGLTISIAGDGKELHQRKLSHNQYRSITLDVSGMSKLILRSNYGENRHCDHLNWLSADLILDSGE